MDSTTIDSFRGRAFGCVRDAAKATSITPAAIRTALRTGGKVGGLRFTRTGTTLAPGSPTRPTTIAVA